MCAKKIKAKLKEKGREKEREGGGIVTPKIKGRNEKAFSISYKNIYFCKVPSVIYTLYLGQPMSAGHSRCSSVKSLLHSVGYIGVR